MSFEEFKHIVYRGIAIVDLKPSVLPSELDLAVQYAIGREMDERGGPPLTVTTEDVCRLIEKHCGFVVYKKLVEEIDENPDRHP